MDEQTGGLGSSTPSNVPMKRKRGRPRKADSGVQGMNMPVMPGSSNKLNSNQTVGTAVVCDDGMLGKEIACVIEGTFNAGYLINAQVAPDTYLRGVVFLSERVVPVTAESDVAPQVRMTERTDIPIPVPVLNPQTQTHSFVPSSGQSNKQSFEAKLQVPMSVDPVLPTELHSGLSASLGDPSAPVVTPMSDLSKIDSSISTGGIMPKGMSKPRPETASIISEFEGNETIKQEETLHEVDASRQAKESIADGGAIKDTPKMIELTEIPIPFLIPETWIHSSVSSSGQCNKQPYEAELQVPMSVDSLLPTELHSGTSVSIENQSASVVTPMSDLLKMNSSISTGGIMPKGISKPGPESQPASIMSGFEGDKTIKQDENLHEVDASRQAKESSADGGATKDSQITSEPINSVPTVENTEKELPTGQQSMPSVYVLNELVPDEPKRSVIEINQIPVSAEHESVPSEVDNFIQKQGFPETDTQEDTKTNVITETITNVDSTNSNRRPNTDIANIPDVGSNHAPGLSHHSILYDREPVPSESKLLSEGPDFQVMSDPQSCSSFGAVNVDANQTAEVLVTSLESENPIGSDAS